MAQVLGLGVGRNVFAVQVVRHVPLHRVHVDHFCNVRVAPVEFSIPLGADLDAERITPVRTELERLRHVQERDRGVEPEHGLGSAQGGLGVRTVFLFFYMTASILSVPFRGCD